MGIGSQRHKGQRVLEGTKRGLRPVDIGMGGTEPDAGVESEEGWCYRPAANHRTAKIAGEQHDPLPQQCDRAAPPAPRGCRFFERAAVGWVVLWGSGPSVPSTGHAFVVAASNDIEFGIL